MTKPNASPALGETALFRAHGGRDLIAVAPLRHVERVIAETGARQLVSVLNAHLMPPTPASIEPARHLRLAVSDHIEAAGGLRHPFADQVDELLTFAGGWDRAAPLLIHCFSGLNRSTAAAYILLCGLHPRTPETLVAHLIRRASDTAAPNRLMVAIADHALGREGRMAAALDTIGPGSPAAEGRPFLISATFDAEPLPQSPSTVGRDEPIARN